MMQKKLKSFLSDYMSWKEKLFPYQKQFTPKMSIWGILALEAYMVTGKKNRQKTAILSDFLRSLHSIALLIVTISSKSKKSIG